MRDAMRVASDHMDQPVFQERPTGGLRDIDSLRGDLKINAHFGEFGSVNVIFLE